MHAPAVFQWPQLASVPVNNLCLCLRHSADVWVLAVQQKNLNVYATAHLSGDVANAVTLLKRMTRPASRKHKAGLLIPSPDLAECQV